MADSNRCPSCGAPRLVDEPGGLCPQCLREKGGGGGGSMSKAKPKTNVLRLVLIAALVLVGGVGTAIYFGSDAARKRAAIVSKVGDAGAHYDRAMALQDQGKVAEAIAEYRAFLRIIPGAPEGHYNLGVALHSQGDVEGAAAEFRKARDNAARGSEIAQLSERALAQTGNQADSR